MNTKRLSADKLISLLMPKESEMDPVGFWALQNMRRISEMNGNSNMTLDGDTIHNKDFTWTAYTTKYTNSQTGYTTAKTLSISGANEGAIDGDHTITTGTNRFTLKDYLAFGMPQTTEWTKQKLSAKFLLKRT
ncbi:MAG: hypothetical protein K6A42_09560 [Treponema sp.]|nr:hypothetical protein [Treponema sp.]